MKMVINTFWVHKYPFLESFLDVNIANLFTRINSIVLWVICFSEDKIHF